MLLLLADGESESDDNASKQREGPKQANEETLCGSRRYLGFPCPLHDGLGPGLELAILGCKGLGSSVEASANARDLCLELLIFGEKGVEKMLLVLWEGRVACLCFWNGWSRAHVCLLRFQLLLLVLLLLGLLLVLLLVVLVLVVLCLLYTSPSPRD